MGFINHCNAALGKTVLSAGRNTLQLTATAGRKTLTSERGFGDRLRMALGYFMAAFLPSGARPQGALPAPFTIFQASFCRQKQTAQGHAREGKERKKLLKEEKGRQNRWGWIAGFLLLHHHIFFFNKKRDVCVSCTLKRCWFHAGPIHWQQWQDPAHPGAFPPLCAKSFVLPFCIRETLLVKDLRTRLSPVLLLAETEGSHRSHPSVLPHFDPHKSKCRCWFCCSKVFLYLKPKGWASLLSEDFESWLLLLKISSGIWSWEQC